MGYAVPAAMGAKVAQPDRVVWAIDGDGCFQMTNQELATCVINNIPIKVAIINNSCLGHGAPVADAVLRRALLQHRPAHLGAARRIPDFVKLADAYGCVGLRCETPGGRRRHDQEGAWRSTTVPVIVDFVVHRDAMVWPMVPAGVSNDAIQVARTAVGSRRGRGHRAARRADKDGNDGMSNTLSGPRREQARRPGPVAPCSPGAASTSTRSPWARPSTRRSPA